MVELDAVGLCASSKSAFRARHCEGVLCKYFIFEIDACGLDFEARADEYCMFVV